MELGEGVRFMSRRTKSVLVGLAKAAGYVMFVVVMVTLTRLSVEYFGSLA